MARIVIIDDDEAMLSFLQRFLSSEGHEVHSATDGKEGAELALRVDADLVITDLWMPTTEGLETVRRVKQLVPKSRIVMMSGRPVLGKVSFFYIAKLTGADATIQKPFTGEEMIVLVHDLLSTGGESVETR
jgi:DNA-binding response OmpR family regulator